MHEALQGLFDLDRRSGVPLGEQIYRALRAAISAGRLPSGTRLPSTRALAAALGVSRNTASLAYDLLKTEGILRSSPGARHVVADPAALRAVAGRRQSGSGTATPAPGLSRRGAAIASIRRWRTGPLGALEPGVPAVDLFPHDIWLRALRRAARRIDPGDLAYRNPAGLPELRRVLSEHLADQRGVVASPAQIVVGPSMQAMLDVLARLLTDEGDAAWLEEPGYLGARAAFVAAGARIVPVGLDSDGMVPGYGMPAPKLIYLTPSHQYPTGVMMPLARRLDLLDRARAAGAVILEDDYDSEFLFEGRAIAAMQGLDPSGRVIYLGTFSETMLPGLRLGYAVVPEALAGPLASALRNTGHLAAVHVQAAMADFIGSGHFRAHARRTMAVYRQRGEALVAALRARLGDRMEVGLPAGGLQLLVRFREPIDDEAVAAGMGRRGFGVGALSGLCLGAPQRGLVIGYTTASDEVVGAAVAALAEELGAAAAQAGTEAAR